MLIFSERSHFLKLREYLARCATISSCDQLDFSRRQIADEDRREGGGMHQFQALLTIN